jgi:hypothetical protein
MRNPFVSSSDVGRPSAKKILEPGMWNCFDRSRSTNYLEIFCCTSTVVNMTTMRIFETILDRLKLCETCTSFRKYYFMNVKWFAANSSNRFKGLEMNVANRIRNFMNSIRKSLLGFFLWNRKFRTPSYWLPDFHVEFWWIFDRTSWYKIEILQPT